MWRSRWKELKRVESDLRNYRRSTAERAPWNRSPTGFIIRTNKMILSLVQL
jgi:hypothetical protein